MSSSVPGQGKVQHDLNASSTGRNADAEDSVDSAGSEDDLILDGSDLLDADPLGDIGNIPNEGFASLPD